MATNLPEVTDSQAREYLSETRARIDQALDQYLRKADSRPAVIHEAMRYSVLAGGKRIRPLLALSAAQACGGDVGPILRHVCALELIHTYSLVHDDLPALDNDELRRGRPTSHVVFGEAVAILTGDALLTEAFVWLSMPVAGGDNQRQMEAIQLVARSIDSTGMIGGQVADLEAERLLLTEQSHAVLMETLEFIHQNKTGRLLTASVMLGGLLANANQAQLGLLKDYGEAVGLAFQIVDDLLDIEESAATLGKTAGKDLTQGKLTFPALVGAEGARDRLHSLVDRALRSADMIGGPVNYLGAIARYICERRH